MNQQLGYSYFSIGLLFMFYNMIASAITLLTLKTPLNFKRATVQTAVGLVTTFLLANSGFFFPAFLCALAFIRGFSIAFFEHTVAKVAKNSKNVSVDIGLLHVPMRFAEFFSVLAAGFVAQAAGYAPVFAATGIFFAAFSFLSLHVLRTK